MDSTYTRATDKTIISRTILIIFLDVLAAFGSFFCALWLRFDFRIGEIQRDFMGGFVSNMLVWCAITVTVFALFKLYSSVWVYVSTPEVFRIIGAYLVLALIGVAGVHFYGVVLPRSSCIIGFVFNFLCTLAIRFSYRILKTLQISISQMLHATGTPNVMVVGAGDAGRAIAEDYLNSENIGEHLACFIDDNPAILHRRLCGVPVAGNRKDIAEAVKKYRIDKIIFAIPTASAATRKNILKICCETGCKVLVLPDAKQMESSEASIHKLRKVDPKDLLGRDSIAVDRDQISKLLSGKTILVTGAAGVVGRELCRQIAAVRPKKLVAFDICEADAYTLQLELQRKFPELNLQVCIGSVQNPASLKSVFTTCHPEVVFHSAAYKYVTFMENSPNEAVLNNVFGTYHAAKAADQFGAAKFILVSDDRAAAPRNIVGACHYLSEKIISMMNSKSETDFFAVRFGNLLVSSSSVIPLFQDQIEKGGPVTVTHPEVTRYFMTEQEAVSLLLQACTYAHAGEIYALDMGEPVKIDTMARNLILLSGHHPDEDIKIAYIGLRPGEKLHEDPQTFVQGLKNTANKRIFLEIPEKVDVSSLEQQLLELHKACEESAHYVKNTVAHLVPGYEAVPKQDKV